MLDEMDIIYHGNVESHFHRGIMPDRIPRYLALNLLHSLQDGRVQRVAGLKAGDLLRSSVGIVFLEDLGQLLRLGVVLDVLELQGGLDAVEKVVVLSARLTVLVSRDSRLKEALTPAEQPERSDARCG
jgi:hypothetical protein